MNRPGEADAGLRQRDPRARGMAVRAFLCQNVAIGCAFGAFGISVLPMQAQFDVSRGLATLGLPLVVLSMGLTGPLSAAAIARIGLRATMLTGIVVSALGYLAIAFAPSMAVVLAAYALPIGIGLALFGSLPASVLAGNWFQPDPGRAIGFVNMPVLMMLAPLAGLPVIEAGGVRALFFALAGAHLLLLPAAWGIVERPGVCVERGQATRAAPAISARALLRQPLFWTIVAGGGALNAVGITASANLVPLVREMGATAMAASVTATFYGLASISGALFAGMLCDRLGGLRTLTLLALGISASWLALLVAGASRAALPAGVLLGLWGAGVFPAINVLAAHLYGAASLPRVLGLFGVCTLPLTFCLPPLAGVLHDASGGYPSVEAAIAAVGALLAILFFAAGRLAGRRPAHGGEAMAA
ncbi:CynX/NimT family MFS transporter [Sphingomonas jatrophae]|nr:MFS transporter [Sphingomonas jatrophae]